MAFGCLLAILVLTVVIRIRLLAAPLERDEGEYAYAGQLILQGVPPYARVYNMKMPGIYAAYALIEAVFGQTHQGIHLGLLMVNLCTIVLLFLLAWRLFDEVAGLVAAAAFALLSLGQPVQGIFANAEHFVILAALGGILMLLRAIDTQRPGPLLGGSVLLGSAFLMKQNGVAFIVFSGSYLLISEIRRRPFEGKCLFWRCSLFLAGVLAPFTVTWMILYWAGVSETFWFWTFDYAKEYVSSVPLSAGLSTLRTRMSQIAGSAVLVWILAGIGLTALVWNKAARKEGLFVAGFTFFSFLAVCPGFYFRPHYFVLLLPAVALLTGIAIMSLRDVFRRSRPARLWGFPAVAIAIVAIFHGGYQQREFLFVMDPFMASRTTYGTNPFPESLDVARYLKEHTSENDRIAILGSEPQIYFYAQRQSASGYIYTYALMETHPFAPKMQQEMIREIETANPKYLVFVNISTSWLVRPQSVRRIFQWFDEYRKGSYEIVGIVDILSMNKTVSLWNEDARRYSPRSPHWMAVFKRKDPS